MNLRLGALSGHPAEVQAAGGSLPESASPSQQQAALESLVYLLEASTERLQWRRLDHLAGRLESLVDRRPWTRDASGAGDGDGGDSDACCRLERLVTRIEAVAAARGS